MVLEYGAEYGSAYPMPMRRESLYRDVAGGTPNTVLIVSTVDDWASFGEVAAKMSADASWQAIQRRIVDDPSAEILSNVITEQFEVP
jgi:hypothetical protein